MCLPEQVTWGSVLETVWYVASLVFLIPWLQVGSQFRLNGHSSLVWSDCTQLWVFRTPLCIQFHQASNWPCFPLPHGSPSPPSNRTSPQRWLTFHVLVSRTCFRISPNPSTCHWRGLFLISVILLWLTEQIFPSPASFALRAILPRVFRSIIVACVLVLCWRWTFLPRSYCRFHSLLRKTIQPILVTAPQMYQIGDTSKSLHFWFWQFNILLLKLFSFLVSHKPLSPMSLSLNVLYIPPYGFKVIWSACLYTWSSNDKHYNSNINYKSHNRDSKTKTCSSFAAKPSVA